MPAPTYDPFSHFIRATHYHPATALAYRIVLPTSFHPQRAYPLLVMLHGIGERGSDNAAQLRNGIGDFARGLQRHQSAIIIIPQCPKSSQWAEDVLHRRPHSALPHTPTAAMASLMDLIASVTRCYRILPDQRYVTGISMGGFGTWDFLSRMPGFFTAAVPICGGGSPQAAARIARTPCWAIHGDADPVIDVEHSRSLVAAVRSNNGVAHYSELAGIKHNSWTAAWAMDEVWDWVFSQKSA